MQYVKTNDGKWIFTELESESDILTLQTIDFQIALSEIYVQVNFTQSNENQE
jgi:hypothetical protein